MKLNRIGIAWIDPLSYCIKLLSEVMNLSLKDADPPKNQVFLISVGGRARVVKIKKIHEGK